MKLDLAFYFAFIPISNPANDLLEFIFNASSMTCLSLMSFASKINAALGYVRFVEDPLTIGK